MKAKKKKKKQPSTLTMFTKLLLIIFLIPATVGIYYMTYLAWQEFKKLPVFESAQASELKEIQANFDIAMPHEYIPIYMTAGERYEVPWTLLAAHHRIETRFSTMKANVSPVGAEGPMQFMPCTWIGWKHESCKDLGLGDVSEAEKTNPKLIAKYGGYGVDADGDGAANPFDIEDAIHSAANFLANEGAAEGHIEKAVFQYNHSDQYVTDVLYYFELYNTYKERLEAVMYHENT